MMNRRRDQRFKLTVAADGVVQVFPDVTVEPNGDDEWIGIGREAAVRGEILVIDIGGTDMDEGPYRVIESRPVMIDGNLRHRIRLQRGAVAPVLFEQQLRRG